MLRSGEIRAVRSIHVATRSCQACDDPPLPAPLANCSSGSHTWCNNLLAWSSNHICSYHHFGSLLSDNRRIFRTSISACHPPPVTYNNLIRSVTNPETACCKLHSWNSLHCCIHACRTSRWVGPSFICLPESHSIPPAAVPCNRVRQASLMTLICYLGSPPPLLDSADCSAKSREQPP